MGCWLNEKGDPGREVRQRITLCMTILTKLDLYWRHANPSIKQKIIVYDAIIRSKLLYGLESCTMNETIKHSLDIFQLKGLRKILGITTTFVDRRNDTNQIYRLAQNHITTETSEGKPIKQLKPFSTVYNERKQKLLNKIILLPENNPLKVQTFQPNSLLPTTVNSRTGTAKREGRPRVKWVETGLETLWQLIRTHIRPDLKYTALNLEDDSHAQALINGATLNLFSENMELHIKT